MIDVATVEAYMRTANPIPHLDDLDADELAFAVAGVHTRRATVMQAPAHHPTRPATKVRPPRRRRVWAFAAAFILILLVVGAAAMLLGDDAAPPADEPAPPTTAAVTPTTLAAVPPPTAVFDDTGSWQATRISGPWVERSIIDVESLPSGGFVVVANDYSSVFASPTVSWSPDGVEWIDADPEEKVTVATPNGGDDPPEVISVMGDRVVVLDGVDPGLWVGDLKAKAWESIRLDTADLAGQVEPFAVASNETEVLVLGEHRPTATPEGREPLFESAERGYLVWLVNPETGEVERHPLSPTWENPLAEGRSSGAVEWLDDRWVIALANAILLSPDGATWTQVPDEDTFNDFLWVNALTSGPPGVVAGTCDGMGPHYLWFSEDGTKWENSYVRNLHVDPAYSDDLGFVVVGGGAHQVTVSLDGRTWHTKPWQAAGPDSSWTRNDDGDIETGLFAASGHTVFVQFGGGAILLTYQ